MELSDMLHPMLELSISIPAIILCFLPMKNHLNGKGKLLLLWGIPTLILWCVGMGWLCWRFHYSTKLCMLLTQALLLLFYCKAVPLSRWKTVNVFLAVCGVFSCMYNLAILIDALLFRRSGAVALSLNSTILYVLLCWLLLESVLARRAAAGETLAVTLLPVLRVAMAAAVAWSAVYRFFTLFATQPWLQGLNPSLYFNVARLVQFWM